MSSLKNTDEKSGALNQLPGGVTQPPTHAAAVTATMLARYASGLLLRLSHTAISSPASVRTAR